jgi:hypothetical protein
MLPVRDIISRAYSQGVPVLIVTNADLSEQAAAVAAEGLVRDEPGRLVRWRDDSDTDALRQALTELFGSI